MNYHPTKYGLTIVVNGGNKGEFNFLSLTPFHSFELDDVIQLPDAHKEDTRFDLTKDQILVVAAKKHEVSFIVDENFQHTWLYVSVKEKTG
jgi:hypothetical protein